MYKRIIESIKKEKNKALKQESSISNKKYYKIERLFKSIKKTKIKRRKKIATQDNFKLINILLK